MNNPTKFKTVFFKLLAIFGMVISCSSIAASLFGQTTTSNKRISSKKVVLLNAESATAETIGQWQKHGYSIAILVSNADKATAQAIERVRKETGHVDYFFEIARNPSMAKSHPEWMASIQGHHEWMRLFENAKKPEKGEVVKVYPWVPVFNREPFEAHVTRVKELLAKLPPPDRIWLNDIQGAPSACGCGHPLCRWTADYGPKQTATKIGDTAPAEFVRRVKKLVPDSEIIPIMTSECEAEDKHTVCGGVGCFEGICWKAFTRQLDQVSRESERIGVACFYKAFERDLPRYKDKSGWIRYAIESFDKMPRARKGVGVQSKRLFAVLQGWDVSDEELQQQILIAERTSPAGHMIVKTKFDQSWTPKIISLDKKK